MSKYASRGLLGLPLLLAVAGLSFCIWNAWGGESVPCLSAGCTLYQTFTIKGFSLWWLGAAAFAVLLFLAATGRSALGRLLSGLGLVLDCLLLGIMVMTLPCYACLGVAVLLALSYAAFRHADRVRSQGRQGTGAPMESPGRLSILLVVWLVCLIMASGVAVHDMLSPWAILNPRSEDGEDAKAHIFFSPSCSACLRLVTGMNRQQASQAAWYPVAEDERDMAVILAVQQRVQDGEPLASALAASLDTPPLALKDYFLPETLALRFKLWCNQARVISSGRGELPFVEFRGLPSALIRSSHSRAIPTGPIPMSPAGRKNSASESEEEALDATLPIDLDGAASCGGDTPCPE